MNELTFVTMNSSVAKLVVKTLVIVMVSVVAIVALAAWIKPSQPQPAGTGSIKLIMMPSNSAVFDTTQSAEGQIEVTSQTTQKSVKFSLNSLTSNTSFIVDNLSSGVYKIAMTIPGLAVNLVQCGTEESRAMVTPGAISNCVAYYGQYALADVSGGNGGGDKAPQKACGIIFSNDKCNVSIACSRDETCKAPVGSTNGKSCFCEKNPQPVGNVVVVGSPIIGRCNYQDKCTSTAPLTAPSCSNSDNCKGGQTVKHTACVRPAGQAAFVCKPVGGAGNNLCNPGLGGNACKEVSVCVWEKDPRGNVIGKCKPGNSGADQCDPKDPKACSDPNAPAPIQTPNPNPTPIPNPNPVGGGNPPKPALCFKDGDNQKCDPSKCLGIKGAVCSPDCKCTINGKPVYANGTVIP